MAEASDVQAVVEEFLRRQREMYADAFVADTRVAEASSRYVCLDTQSDQPASLRDGIVDD